MWFLLWKVLVFPPRGLPGCPPPMPDEDLWPLDVGWAAKRRPPGRGEKLGKIRKTYNLASSCALT